MRIGRLEATARIVSIVAVLVASFSAHAQQRIGPEQSGWYMYFGDHPIDAHWGLHLEGQWRRAPVISNPEQLLLRPGVNYDLGKGLMVVVAYTYVRDDPPSGSTQIGGSEPRQSINEEFKQRMEFRHVVLGQNVRLQQTMAGDRPYGQKDLTWKFIQRVHYRLEARIPTVSKHKLLPQFYSLYDEVIDGFGPNGGHQTLKQNRSYGALGWPLSHYVEFELGYMHQYRPVSNGIIGEQNNALQVTISSNAPLGLLLKRHR